MRHRVTVSLPLFFDVCPEPAGDLGLVIGPVRARPLQAKGETKHMATNLQLTDVQEVDLSIGPKDREGNPAQLDGVPTWVSSDPSIVTVTAAADGLSAVAATVGPLGTATVTVTGQGDLTGGGSDEVTDTVTVTVVGSQASSLNVTAGTPTQRPGV
jgi:hypothetical protein